MQPWVVPTAVILFSHATTAHADCHADCLLASTTHQEHAITVVSKQRAAGWSASTGVRAPSEAACHFGIVQESPTLFHRLGHIDLGDGSRPPVNDALRVPLLLLRFERKEWCM